MLGLGLYIKFDSFVAHMFFAWSFSHNKALPIAIKKNKYCISFNTCNTVFAWRSGNKNKNRT